jgi:hypothetical protein
MGCNHLNQLVLSVKSLFLHEYNHLSELFLFILYCINKRVAGLSLWVHYGFSPLKCLEAISKAPKLVNNGSDSTVYSKKPLKVCRDGLVHLKLCINRLVTLISQVNKDLQKLP